MSNFNCVQYGTSYETGTLTEEQTTRLDANAVFFDGFWTRQSLFDKLIRCF